MVKGKINLVGDAILDNFFWLKHKDHDLTYELSKLDFKVNNYAVDCVKVEDIIKGISPKEEYIKSRSYHYKLRKDKKMYPLKYIAKHAKGGISSIYNLEEKSEIPDDMTVISMGGADIQAKIMGIVMGSEYFINSVLTRDFILNYEKVLDTISKHCPKMVLVSVYLPYLGPKSSYGSFSSFAIPVMEKWNEFIHTMGRKYNIPVLDLSKTLNSKTRKHYGTNDTRTSNVSGECIAKCISYIHENYSGYKVFYAPNCDFTKITVE